MLADELLVLLFVLAELLASWGKPDDPSDDHQQEQAAEDAETIGCFLSRLISVARFAE